MFNYIFKNWKKICEEKDAKITELKAMLDRNIEGSWKPWHPKILGMEYSFDTVECSECGKSNSWKSNFCPHCGADMRGIQHESK